MKRRICIIIGALLAVGLLGCIAQKDSDTVIIGGADGPTSVYISSKTDGADISLANEPYITGTWQTASMGYEDDYPDAYRGGASLSRSN